MSEFASSDYNRLCRAISAVVKGAERCLDKPEVRMAGVVWNGLSWEMAIDIGIGLDIDLSAKGRSAHSPSDAVRWFLEHLGHSIDAGIAHCESLEDEAQRDVLEYGHRFEESRLATISGLKVLRKIGSSISVK